MSFSATVNQLIDGANTIPAETLSGIRSWKNLPARVTSTSVPKIPIAFVFPLSDRVCGDLKFWNGLCMYCTYLCNDASSNINQYSGFLSLINIITPAVLDADEVKTAMELYAFKMKFVTVDTLKDFSKHILVLNVDIRKKIHELLLEDNSCEGTEREKGYLMIDVDVPFSFNSVSSLDYNPRYTTAVSSILFLLMFKAVNELNHAGWMKNRWRTFTGTLAVPTANPQGIDERSLPTSNASGVLCKLLGGFPNIRRRLFMSIMASSESTSYFQRTALSIVLLVRGTEFGHITIIIEYVITAHPEILAHPLLKQEAVALFQAIGEIKKLPNMGANGPQYCKIFYPGQDTQKLNRNNFPRLIYVAKSIGAQQIPSLQNYTTALDSGDRPQVTSQLDTLVAGITRIEAQIANGNTEIAKTLEEARARTGVLQDIAGLLHRPGAVAEVAEKREHAR